MTAEEAKAKKHAYYLANREHLKVKSQEWRAKNRERILQKMREYYQNNKEKCRNLAKQYFKTYKRPELSPEQKERARIRSREWRRKNPGATTLQVRSWAERNPEKYKASNANKYAFRKSVGAANKRRVSGESILEMFSAQNGLCFYCKCHLGDYHIDHKVPLVRGGQHERSNLCLSCPPCNIRKHAMTDQEFIAVLER